MKGKRRERKTKSMKGRRRLKEDQGAVTQEGCRT